MPAPNPFIFGSPVPASRVIGRTKALRQVIDRLSNLARESTSIVAADRMGRTSFLRYLTSKELRDDEPELQSFVQVFFDGITAKNSNDQEIWKQILKAAKKAYFDNSMDAEFDQAIDRAEKEDLSIADLEDLCDCLADRDKLLLVAMDDFHHLLANPKLRPPNSFFDDLRSLLIRPPHTLVLVTASPRFLMDLWNLGPGGSPFYNIFATVILEKFTDEEISNLLEVWLKGTNVIFTEDDKQLVNKYSRGHPMLVQYAAHLLYDCHVNAVADKAGALDKAINDDMGQVMTLYRHLYRQLNKLELEALDNLRKTPEKLSPPQRKLLEEMIERGALPPGVNLP